MEMLAVRREKKKIKHQPKILVASQPALCTAALVLLWFYYYCCFLQSENNSQRKKHGKQLATRKNSKLECSDSVGGKNTRGSGLPTLLRKKIHEGISQETREKTTA